MKKLNTFLPVMSALAAVLLLSSCEVDTSPLDTAKHIPIQHTGRVKSLDAFSRQAVEVITGKPQWAKEAPFASVLKAVFQPDKVYDTPWIRIDHPDLKKTLGLSIDRKYFSYEELESSFPDIEALVRSSSKKRDRDIRPSITEQKAELLFQAIITLRQLMNGALFKVVPSPDDGEWLSLTSLSRQNAAGSLPDRVRDLSSAFIENRQADFGRLAHEWTREVHQITRNRYQSAVDLEVRYYRMRPFEHAWIAYLISFVLLAFFTAARSARWIGWSVGLLGVFFHSYGIVMRCLILQRPPVSNMFESMIFMNWILIVAAVIFAFILRNSKVMAIGSIISALVMIYGNLLPIDSGMQVLVPVLRSNYWLTIHVMTIVASYGLFGLAMGLGHWYLIRNKRSGWTPDENQRMDYLMNRTIQIGVLLLGAGTILGGVWANESWGRFWGWDPKETWALITFLGYLAVVHLKHVDRIGTRGIAIASVLGFLLVLMTWYGVNFVLGRGLHSYGQGSGGREWISLYLLLELFFIVWVLIPSKHNAD